VIDKGFLTKVVSSVGESNEQEAQQQVQKATTDTNPGDRAEADPSGLESLEKGARKTESSGETKDDADANKGKSEADSSEGPRVATTLTEEPEAQEQTEGQGRTDEAAKPPASTQPDSDSTSERQPSLRATPMYWRRFTTRYMATVAPTS
jgi:hypothetical protein